MIFKILVVVLLIDNIAALGTALVSMVKGMGKNSKNTAKWLTIRVSLAAALIIVISIGFYTGDLGVSAPWLSERDELISN